MAKTFLDLQNNVRTFLDEAAPANWTDNEVAYQINYAYHYLVSKVMEIYEEYYLTTTPLQYSSVTGQQEYPISPYLLKTERVEINLLPTVPNNQPQRASAIKMDELPLNLGNNQMNGSNFFNIGYYVIGNQSAQNLGFVPVPQVTATNNISVWGIVAPADLVDAGDAVLIPYVDNFAQIIAKLAGGNLLKKGQQEVNYANDLLNEAGADIANMQTFIKERQSDGPLMIEEAAWEDVNVANYIY